MLTTTIQNWLKQTLGGFQGEIHQSGANSRGFLIQAASQSFFLKCYPKNATSAIRIEREINFIKHCQQQSIANVATVIASSIEHYCVLFEFVENNLLDHDKRVNQSYVLQSFDFIKAINQVANKNLTLASESAHRVVDFQTIVESRLSALAILQLNKKLPDDFAEAFKEKIQFFLQKVQRYYQQIKPLNYHELQLLPLISPSDFGFHNALLVDDRYYFIDFEYAGNDSVWKFICDFFAQPAYPVDLDYIKHVTAFISWQTIEDNSQSFCYVYQFTLFWI